MTERNDRCQAAETMATLVDRFYLLPRDAFTPQFERKLVADFADAVTIDRRETSAVERLGRALTNGQAYIGSLGSTVQAVRDRDAEALINMFAEDGTQMPTCEVGALIDQYSRGLQCINTLVTVRLPTAGLRALRARGEKLIAGSRLLEDFARQRLAWSTYLMAPVQEFERSGVALSLAEMGVPQSESGRIRQIASKMFQMGVVLSQRADRGEGGFDPRAGEEFEWFFKQMEEIVFEQSEPPAEN